MTRPLLYLTFLLVLLVFLSSCSRQFARIQPTPGVHYQALASPEKPEPIAAILPAAMPLPVVDLADITEKAAVPESEIVASAKPLAALHPSLAKKMIRIQKQLMSVSTSEKKESAVNRVTKIRKATDSKGTMGIVGLALGAVGLILTFLLSAPYGILLAVPGLIFSIIGLKGSRRGLAIAGVIVNTLALVLLIVVVIAVATLGFT